MVRQSFPNFVSHTYIREIIKKARHSCPRTQNRNESKQFHYVHTPYL